MEKEFQITVGADDVDTAIQQGASKGWSFVRSEALEDGTQRLYFQRLAVQAINFPAAAPKAIDPNVAWLELLGFFGFLGIGYLVANRVNEGIIRLAGFIIFLTVGWVIASILTLVLIGFCMMPILLVAQFAVPIWSALELRRDLENQYAPRV